MHFVAGVIKSYANFQLTVWKAGVRVRVTVRVRVVPCSVSWVDGRILCEHWFGVCLYYFDSQLLRLSRMCLFV